MPLLYHVSLQSYIYYINDTLQSTHLKLYLIPSHRSVGATDKMSSLPTFEPYVLTPFDHVTASIHFATFLTFRPKKLSIALSALEKGALRLVTQLPFLTGNVASSTRLPGKESVFELQPPTAEFIREHPFLKIRHHQPGFKEIDLLPIPPESAGEELSPAFRIQANVIFNEIIVGFAFHHVALDGLGLFNVKKQFAACCLDPDADSSLLGTNPQAEEQCRRAIFEAAASQVSEGTCGHDYESKWEPAPPLKSEETTSVRFRFNFEKVTQLRRSCVNVLQARHQTDAKVSTNTILTAIVWLCFIRARFGTPTARHSIPAQSCVTVWSDARSKLEPQLPASYLGNALLTTEAYTPIEPVITCMGNSTYGARTTGRVEPDDVRLLVDLACSINDAIGRVTDASIRDSISQFAKREDWSSPLRLGDISLSGMGNFNIYSLNFGPFLGPVDNLDMPETRYPGAGWIVQGHDKGGPRTWVVRLALETAVMERFRGDDLVRWLESNEGSKL